MSENELGAEAMAQLVLAPFPMLLYVQLHRNKLNAAAAKQLAKGNWPLLYCLSLTDNYLNDAAMFHLSQGNWPRLQSLSLQHNKITAMGIEFMIHSSWPFLETLDFDRTAVSAETWAVLSLKPDSLPETASLGVLTHIRAERQVTQAVVGQAVLWPAMTKRRLSSCVGSSKKDYRKMWTAEYMA